MTTRRALFGVLAVLLPLACGVYIVARTKTVSGYKSGYGQEHALAALSMALKGKETVVVFGSSEMTMQNQPLNVYRFFPEEKGLPVFGFGQAGMQHLAILAQLLAVAGDLEGSRLVVMVGPGWFLGRTSVDQFLKYTPPYISAGITLNRKSYPAAYQRLEEFVRANETEFVNPPAFVQALDGRGSSFASAVDIVEGYLSYWYQMSLFAARYSAELPDRGFSGGKDWPTLMAEGNESQIAISRRNSAFVSDKYIKENVGAGGLDLKLNPPPLDGPEEQDFDALVDFLKKSNARPLFVLQGFNRFAYQDVSPWPGLILRLKAKLDEAGMPHVDLWEEVYQPSAYFDIQHIGPYNWAQVDRAIDRVFFAGTGDQ